MRTAMKHAWIWIPVLFAGCSGEISVERDARTITEFELFVSPSNGTMTFGGSAVRGLDPVTVVQDETPGSGPPESVELVTAMTGSDIDGTGPCFYVNSFCGDVTIRSFYSDSLENVFSEITSIIPVTGHEGLNSDPAQQGLDDTLGLWGYGTLDPGQSNNRLWVFGDDGVDFVVSGRVMADLVPFIPNDPPNAADDTYDGVGNTALDVSTANGLLSNDGDPDPGDTLVVTGFDPITALGGTGSVNPDGSFQYIPPLGVTGVDDSFNYTIEDQHGASDTAAVTISLQERVWYVDNSSTPGGDGRSISPFDTLPAAQSASAPGDILYLFAGSGTDAGQDQGILLQDDQRLIGQRVPLVVNGLVLEPAAGTPVISNTGGTVVTLASNNVVAGLILGSAALGIEGLSAGTVEISDLDAQDGINLDGPSAAITRVRLLGVDGFGLRVGNASLTVDTLEVVNTNGTGVEVHDCNPTVINGTTVETTNGRAVDLQLNRGTDVSFDSVFANNTGVRGINLVHNRDGIVSFSTINLTVSETTAFRITGGTTRVLDGTIDFSATATPLSYGFSASSAVLDVTLERLSAIGAEARAMNLFISTGSFTIAGQGNIVGSGGTIDGGPGALVSQESDLAVSINGLDIRNTIYGAISTYRDRSVFTITNSSITDAGSSPYSSVRFDQIDGAQILIEDSTIEGMDSDGIRMPNPGSGEITIRRTTIRNHRSNGTNAINIADGTAEGSTDFTMLVDDCDIELNSDGEVGIEASLGGTANITVQNSRFSGVAPALGRGIVINTMYSAIGQVLIEGNTFTNTTAAAGSAITVGASGTAYYRATIRSNNLTETSNTGIYVNNRSDSDSRALVESNTVNGVTTGIRVRAFGSATGRLDATLDDNTLTATRDDIQLSSEDSLTLCANPHDNEGDLISAEALDTSTFMLHGYRGGAFDMAAVQARLLNRNPLIPTAIARADATSSGYLGGLCLVP